MVEKEQSSPEKSINGSNGSPEYKEDGRAKDVFDVVSNSRINVVNARY